VALCVLMKPSYSLTLTSTTFGSFLSAILILQLAWLFKAARVSPTRLVPPSTHQPRFRSLDRLCFGVSHSRGQVDLAGLARKEAERSRK
jgi:hypothetical protein